ncbi:uncharacterized protein LOC121774573 [Salvia splendens]|uniref:uncharacterized protein LOC121774573 n=1 Tax=Salvia splendens TaxID=180675 RepID=UPI001C25B806|nr:uncharacterized protein LOC121774573 [Salvia splendens]
MVETRSSSVQSDDTLARVAGLEKAVTTLDSPFDACIARCLETQLGPILLKLRGAQPPSTGQPSDASGLISPPGSQPSMSLPPFDGTDAIGWLARASQYFMVNKTPTSKRLDPALIALLGPALPWVQILMRRYPSLSWDQFAHELLVRFGDNTARDGYEALAATKHVGSLSDYIAAFESHLAQLPDLTDCQFLGIFLANLQPSIRLQLRENITNYSDVVQMAKRYEKLYAPLGSTTKNSSSNFSTGRFSYQSYSSLVQTASRDYSTSITASLPNGPRPPRRFHTMPQEEYQKHLAARTCFLCGLKYNPTHRCPPKTLQFIITHEEDDSTDDDDQNYNNESSICCHTMKLSGSIAIYNVTVMVDSGASHCFIADHVATRLGLVITSTTTFSVRLGDGTKVRSGGICHDVKLLLALEPFLLSCYVFPLRGVDIILGISWLASLGDVKANWRDLTMEFTLLGCLVHLQGDPTLTRRACTPFEIRSFEAGDDSWLIWSLDADQTTTAFGFAETLPAASKRQLQVLIEAFPEVTTAAASLPPHRPIDHCIPLQAGSQPVSVRPYRYNHAQKDEMEKLVSEMLTAGIIQLSTSPFSSLVLLVHKKDGSWRFCVDYRELNKRTVPCKYPILVIQELLDELHGSR